MVSDVALTHAFNKSAELRIHEDPHVVSARPTRLPKSSPIVDSSNTRPLTTERRSSRSDKLPPKAPVAHRIAPTPNSHFLSAFNVNECFDFRAIPDPPSPQPRNRRRLSTPTLTNVAQYCDPLPKDNNRGPIPLLGSDGMQSMSGKRSRKSLCHVPSPLETEQRDDPHISDSPPLVARKVLQVNLCLDDELEHAGSADGNKRRKKRQSMELPREWVLEHAKSVEASFQPPRAAIPFGRSNSDRMSAFVGDMENMKELQALVRGYCNLRKEERGKSQEAKSIEEHTGYPLVTPKTTDHPLSHDNRRIVFQKMAPIIDQIDKRKAEDIAKWEHATECRVERSTKSGRYRYVSIETNTKVGSQEYKRRYMDVLEQEASTRLAKAQDWMDKLAAPLPQNDQGSTPDSEDMESLEYGGRLIPESSSDMEANEASSDRTQELDLGLNDILALETNPSDETEQESLPPRAHEDEDTTMELCDMSAGIDLEEQSEIHVEFEQSISTGSFARSLSAGKEDDEEADDSLAEEQSLPEPTRNDELDHKDISPKVVPKSVSPTEMDLLPIPHRGEKSSHPAIAEAERKLWMRIDAALQDYSEEVMRIMEFTSAKSSRNDLS